MKASFIIWIFLVSMPASALNFKIDCSSQMAKPRKGKVIIQNPDGSKINLQNPKNISYSQGIFSPSKKYLALIASIKNNENPQASFIAVFLRRNEHRYKLIKDIHYGRGIMAVNFDVNEKQMAVSAGTLHVYSLPKFKLTFDEYSSPADATTVNELYFDKDGVSPLCQK